MGISDVTSSGSASVTQYTAIIITTYAHRISSPVDPSPQFANAIGIRINGAKTST